jgi:hypothetical protein
VARVVARDEYHGRLQQQVHRQRGEDVSDRPRAAALPLFAGAWQLPESSPVDAPISMSESRPKPGGATDLAVISLMASTVMPATFQPRVTYSRMKPRRTRTDQRGKYGRLPGRIAARRDAGGVVVVPAAEFFRELAACGRPAATHRSYGMNLLRWWRFLWATGTSWDQATSIEAQDFCCWIGRVDKRARPHWRYPGGGAPGRTAVAPGMPNPVTGKRSPGRGYAAATVVHCESVLRGFYGFHLEAGTGPMANPFPLARGRRAGRANAHHNPMQPFAGERAGRYRPKAPRRVPRQIPDERFDELFALLGSHRDRALVAFWVSTGARASELLGATAADAEPGQQLITVIRKGTRQAL